MSDSINLYSGGSDDDSELDDGLYDGDMSMYDVNQLNDMIESEFRSFNDGNAEDSYGLFQSKKPNYYKFLHGKYKTSGDKHGGSDGKR